jgi:RecA-family ATPase
MSAAMGKTIFPSFRPAGKSKVLWLESEDPPEEIHRRYRKYGAAYNLSDDDLSTAIDNIKLCAGEAFPLAELVAGQPQPTKYFKGLQAQVREYQPRVLIVDPLSHYTALDENDNTQVAFYMNLLRSLCNEVEGGAVVWVNHHVAKMREGENSSSAGRGASAGRDAMRSAFGMAPLTRGECDRHGVSNPDLFIKFEQTKSNYSALSGPVYFQTETGDLGGVLRQVDMESRAERIAVKLAQDVAKHVAEAIGDNSENLPAAACPRF